MEDSPHQRAIWRSARLNAASRQPPDVPAKLPLGREPSTGSADWAHRCRVPTARLVPGDADPRLHALGLPRPRTADGWPMPFAGEDPDDPCATERDLEILCCREGRCQVCGLGIPPGTGFAVHRPGHRFASLVEGVAPWVEGRAALHLRCLRFSIRYCPELIRQFRQGVAHVVSEPSSGHHKVLDGVMLDTHDYVGFVEPVWHLESARDSPGTSDAALGRLEDAAAVNARATETLFPRLAGRPRR